METNGTISRILKFLISLIMVFGIINVMLAESREEMQFSFILFIISGVSLIMMIFIGSKGKVSSETTENAGSHE